MFYSCIADVARGVGELPKYIGTLKGLSSIRDSVWDMLNQVLCARFDTLIDQR